jgi:hypothetical protein
VGLVGFEININLSKVQPEKIKSERSWLHFINNEGRKFVSAGISIRAECIASRRTIRNRIMAKDRRIILTGYGKGGVLTKVCGRVAKGSRNE